MENEIVLGYLEIRLVDGVVDIMNLFVSEDARRRGVATALMNEMIEKEDFNRIMLEVNENNNPAIKLYTKLGFKEISYRERYYDEDTALIMEKVK
jgi:ribosomal-protein-alanine N-acetyltransferase